MYRDYAADGVISACRHSVKALRHTLRTITPDFQADFPDFKPAVKAAIARHRNGGCTRPRRRPTPTAARRRRARAPRPCPRWRRFDPDARAQHAAADVVGASPAGCPAACPRLRRRRAHAPAGRDALRLGHAGGPAAAESGISRRTPRRRRRRGRRRAGTADLAVPGSCSGWPCWAPSARPVGARRRHARRASPGVHHAWREAAYRTRGTWRDFSEWLRLGR